MADIARDTKLNGGSVTASSLTYSYTCTGANGLLWVFFYTGSSATLVVSVTYNGVAMTSGGSVVDDAARKVYGYFLPGPATGPNNVVITLNTGDFISSVAISYANAGQTGILDASTTNNDSSNTNAISSNLTTVADRCWIVMAALSDQAGMVGSGAVSNQQEDTVGNFAVFDSNGVITPAGVTAVGFSMTFFTPYHVMVIASFAPVTGTPAVALWLPQGMTAGQAQDRRIPSGSDH